MVPMTEVQVLTRMGAGGMEQAMEAISELLRSIGMEDVDRALQARWASLGPEDYWIDEDCSDELDELRVKMGRIEHYGNEEDWDGLKEYVESVIL